MSCSIPDFVNDIPTIAPLPAFPIVCATNFPPALTIPDIPLPPCIDGLSFTSSGINVNVITGSGYTNTATSSSSFNITEGNCSFNFGGSITINLPDVAFTTGGSSIDPTTGTMDDQVTRAYTISLDILTTHTDGSWSTVGVRVKGGKYNSPSSNTASVISPDRFGTAITRDFDDISSDRLPHNVYVAIPWVVASSSTGTLMNNGAYMKTAGGGVIGMTAQTLPTYPTLVKNVTLGTVTYHQIGSWAIKMAFDTAGAKWVNRPIINQMIEDDIVV